MKRSPRTHGGHVDLSPHPIGRDILRNTIVAPRRWTPPSLTGRCVLASTGFHCRVPSLTPIPGCLPLDSARAPYCLETWSGQVCAGRIPRRQPSPQIHPRRVLNYQIFPRQYTFPWSIRRYTRPQVRGHRVLHVHLARGCFHTGGEHVDERSRRVSRYTCTRFAEHDCVCARANVSIRRISDGVAA